jgi:hypothetical protein
MGAVTWIGLMLGLQLACFCLSLWLHRRSWRYRCEAEALLRQSEATRTETASLLVQLDRELEEGRGNAPPSLQ